MLTIPVTGIKKKWYLTGIIVGIVGTLSFTALGVKLIVFPDKPAAPADLTVLSGPLAEAYAEQGDLVLALEGEPVVFKLFDMHIDGTIEARFDAFVGGAHMEIGVPTAEIASPRRNGFTGQSFRAVRTITVDGTPVLTLEEWRGFEEANDRLGLIIVPVMLALSLALIPVCAVSCRREKIARSLPVPPAV